MNAFKKKFLTIEHLSCFSLIFYLKGLKEQANVA